MKFERWKKEIRRNWQDIVLALLFFAISLTIYSVAGNYADYAASAVVSDIILDNIPAIDIPFLYLYGYLAVLAILLVYPFIYQPKRFSYVAYQLSLLIIIRSFFITLTHLKVPSDALLVDIPLVYKMLAFENDMFFSAHTAVPFLGALLFKKEKIGVFFAVATVLLAMMVLVMHLHYSIDVFAAFFITYGTYRLGSSLFGKEKDKKF